MPTQSHKSNALLSVNELSVVFGKHVVLENINFEVNSGEIVAVLGPNGAGKSTLMKAILGLAPFEGEVLFHGKPISQLYGRIGYVPQRFDVDPAFPMTVSEFLLLALPRNTMKSRVQEVLEEVRLNPVIIAQQPLWHLSGGQLQRVLIARAILNDPEILFLDEPSQGIDISGTENFVEIIKHLNKRHNTTIFMISHEVDIIERFVTQVICLNKQLVCSGPPKEMINDDTIGDLYGKNRVKHHHNH